MPKILNENDRILGIHVSLNVDVLLFAAEPIDNTEDEAKAERHVGKFKTQLSRRIQNLIEEDYFRTDGDDVVVTQQGTDYITPENLSDFVEIIPI